MSIQLLVRNGEQTLAKAEGSGRVHLVYQPKYKKGDQVLLKVDHAGFYRLCLEDTMPWCTVYLPGTEAVWPVPFGLDRAGYSPRSFVGEKHLIRAEQVLGTEAGSANSAGYGNQENGALIEERHEQGNPNPAGEVNNLSWNPYDAAEVKGMYPHASTNVTYANSLRNRIFPDRGLFAARNAIDGYTCNESHRLYPYQSFGVNRMEDAWLKVEFGRSVDLQYVVLWLRCEFPHDTCWKSAEFVCIHADGSETVHSLAFQKTMEPQRFELLEQNVTSVRMLNMKLLDEPGFAALTELKVYGTEHPEGQKV